MEVEGWRLMAQVPFGGLRRGLELRDRTIFIAYAMVLDSLKNDILVLRLHNQTV